MNSWISSFIKILFSLTKGIEGTAVSHRRRVLTRLLWQESLANAKVSSRQQCVYMKAHTTEKKSTAKGKERNVEKYIQRVTMLSLAILVYFHSFSCCCLPNLRNPAKFSENSSLYQFKVVQSHRSWCQSKAHMQLPISH